MSKLSPTAGIYTLGCKVNQYESEAIAERMAERGFTVLSPTECCDVYVINTCTVTGESDRKAGQFIRRAIHKNPQAYVLVTGCFSQTQPDRLAAIRGVDFICGNANKQAVVDAALALVKGGKKADLPTVDRTPPDAFGFEPMQIEHFDRTRAYVKIEDGCESHCTYCIIPAARGRIRSKPPCEVLREVRTLTANGCREIVLTGIETASYGKDLQGVDLAGLLEEIDRIPGVGRIRLGSLDPSLIKEDFVRRIARLPSLAPHFHLSMQSGSDRILARMKRKYNTAMALAGIERLRRAIPDVSFTTDMIVGFPQESEEDFNATMEFARKAGFLMIHVFPYSRRTGTPAATMAGQIPGEVKKDRVARLSSLERSLREKIHRASVGRVYPVLFETDTEGFSVGHTPNFIEITVPTARPLSGETHEVVITEAREQDCLGELLPIS